MLNLHSDGGFGDWFVGTAVVCLCFACIFFFLCFRFYKLNFDAAENSEIENNGLFKMLSNIVLLVLMGIIFAFCAYCLILFV